MMQPASTDDRGTAAQPTTATRRALFVATAVLLAGGIAIGVLTGLGGDGGVAAVFEADDAAATGLGPVGPTPTTLPVGLLPPLGCGEEVDLAKYAGRPLLINFWATWCGPCMEEMPILRDAERRVSDQVTFLGINVQDAEPNALEFLAELDVTYDQARDPLAAYFTEVGGFGMPTTLLVDPEGRIVYRHTGTIEAAQLDELLADHLGVKT